MLLHNLCLVGCLAVLAVAKPLNENRAAKFQFIGINESGPEFGAQNLPGTYNVDYTWPNLPTIKTFVSQGMNVFRVNILMERIIPNQMTGPLDPNYLGNLTQTVNYITSLGAYAIIVPHNYGRYYGNVITSASDFQTFWKTLATPYKSNSRVIFDTNNEYHDMAGTLVAQLNQAAINGIRGAGATSQYITAEGNAYTGAWTWTTQAGTDGKTNAQTMGSLTDSSNKLIYQMHQYLDADGSGTSATCVNSTIGADRLVAATQWLRSNKKKGLIGEFAGGVNSVCESAVDGMLSYIQQNTDVWTGALWWAAGPWWGSYMFSLEPTSGPAYSTYDPEILKYA
ncbi:glycoside hydrolase family 5 protein [Zasmidium cellare ATCC 36951]|uniref:cellulase n=1 Tax=Zasmidium cellare ATCC 36951 TaxID=1080233 RepID=A0A6A6C7J2_ZASCE|nr:glycoside hydrolase family 5 protein [Zasmidium cellare ATCC 36951]KAF2163064.1 glycoside hydrolase family 5 protein [Zasmidium cellare ATCC 36951]